MGILQPGKAALHNPTRDQVSSQAIDSLLPQIPIQGVLCLQVTLGESRTLVHMYLTLMGRGVAGEVIPHQEEHPDSATKQGLTRGSRRKDTEVITGVTDRGLRHPVK